MEDLRHARQHTGRDEGDMLAHHSIQCDLDEVDAFVSHAWDDDFEQRYVALRAWATQFEMEHGRTPIIWLGALTPGSHTSRPPPQLSSMIARKQCSTRARASATRHTFSLVCACLPFATDKACIDQFSIEESLKCLPIFLSHCESFVVLGGSSWSTRLWWYAPALPF